MQRSPKDQQTYVTAPKTGFPGDHLHSHVLLDIRKNDGIWLLKPQDAQIP